MTTLVVGASGATGRLLVEQLLKRGQNVKVIIRSPDKLPDVLASQDNLTVIHASILNLSDAEMARYVNGCDAVASCLGHNLTFRGMFGQPRRLVTDATRRLCRAIKANTSEGPTKFVLMNTAGNSNRDLHEPISFGQKCVIGLLRLLLPPHVDNEQAADYLRTGIGQDDDAIEWAVVRPDSLIDETRVTEYDAHSSPTRSAIFNPGSTSRINVGHFMAHLITDANTWERWKGRMPVVYNKSKGVVRGTAVNLRAIGERCAFATSCAR
ncbi:MAG TPA: NAD(P)-dependent oxidoreductase [Fuerstia sp.]|nr:NAD(P)-dependent oxidoreductase [Fuerstiella sp.]